MSDFSRERLVGLDIARSVAILAVMLAHARYLTDSPGDYFFLSLSGKIGVELFFVLSGFLIGVILVRFCDEEPSLRVLFRFWIRRWFRTLPAYFAVLIFVWLAFGKFDPLYFLFLQDLVIGNWDILPVSWSLVIEEWFYLLFAPVCFVFVYFSPRLGFLAAAIMLVVLTTWLQVGDYEACAAAEKPLKCFENDIRKFTFRFTSLGFGVLLAWAHHREDLRTRFGSHTGSLLGVTLAVTATMFFICGDTILNFPGLLPVPLAFAIFYPLMGLSSLLIIVLLYVAPPKLPDWMLRCVSYVSLTSYSCYLWHLLVNEQIRLWLPGWNQYLLILIFFFSAFAVSGLSYLIVERPFMRLRDRFAP